MKTELLKPISPEQIKEKEFFVDELKTLLDDHIVLAHHNRTVYRYLKILLQQLGGNIQIDPSFDKNNDQFSVSLGMSGSIQLINVKTNEWVNNDNVVDVSKLTSIIIDTFNAVIARDFDKIVELFSEKEVLQIVKSLKKE